MKQNNKNILYISTIVPKNGIGSWIIALRHLKRLESSGYKITIVIPVSKKHLLEKYPNWKVIILPDRKWWWPPCNFYNKVSLNIRFWLWYKYLQSILNKKYCSVLTIIPDNIAIFAAYTSKKMGVPLSVIVHDEWELNATNEKETSFIKHYKNYIFKISKMVWTVSNQMTEKYQNLVGGNINLLYPIPDGKTKFIDWKDSFKGNPILAVAGGFEKDHLNCFIEISNQLKKINGKFLVVRNENNDQVAFNNFVNSCDNLILVDQFDKNTEVIEYIRNHASAFLISFVGDYKWSELSFPSKFIEFSHIGLPMLIIAPKETPLSEFAKKKNWYSYYDDLNDNRISEFFFNMIDKDKWNIMAEQTRDVALNEFDSDVIQNQFELELAKNES